ncbi:MAG: agmatinase [Gemmatimonadota bacterium]|nr:agmatinase [Gemmatimonadota bacterium]
MIPCLIGLPYDASSSFRRGPALAPPQIREALYSDAGHLWTEALQDLGAEGGLQDAGDLTIPDGPKGRELIESAIGIVLHKGWGPIALGGDHSVTYPVLRAMHAAHPSLSIVHLDAHPDLYDEFEGDRFSHACPFARIMEEGLAKRLVQVGIRTMNAHLQEQATKLGVEVIDMRAWMRGERPVVSGPVYLSLDLDVLDPAFAPGLSHREPGGLSVRDVLGVIQSMKGTLVGADIVECNPLQDTSGLTVAVAAKFVKEIAGRMQMGSVD